MWGRSDGGEIRWFTATLDETHHIDSVDRVPDGRCYGVIDRTFDHLDDPRCDDRSNCIDKTVLKRIKQCLFAEELCDHEMVNIAFLHE